MTLIINAAHALLIGPAFIYYGLNPDQIPEMGFNVLLYGGALMLLYHAYKAYNKLKEGKSAWVNWIHIFLVAPLLMIIGYLKKDASRRYFELMLLLGFSATGYHALYAIREIMLL
jgi:hypothetical protein